MADGIVITAELDSTGALDQRTWSKAAGKAISKALVSGKRKLKAEAVREVRALKKMRAKDVRSALTVRQKRSARVDPQSAQLDIAGKPVSLIAYGARQIKAGVSVAVNRGKRTRICGAFIATMPSGGRHVFTRRGRSAPPGRVVANRVARLPIDRLMGSRPIDALRQGDRLAKVGEAGAEEARKTFARVLPGEIEKVTQ